MKELQPGDLLDRRYRIANTLARGGFGQTYIAEDTRRPSSPRCVVKQLKPASNNPKFLQDARRLFRTEAETLERLGNHDRIPRLLAYFEEEEEFYLVQELIEGQSLNAELQLGQSWSSEQIVTLLQEVLEILRFVHENRAIHRDIKPENLIRRDRDRQLVLIDFGTVKQIRGGPGQYGGTIAIGTPGYMPMEQGRGNPQPNSDIYALGTIGIQAATGLNISQIQDDPDTGETIWQPWSKIDPGLATILAKMTRYHFKDRYQSAEEVLEAISQYLAAKQPQSPQPTVVSPATTPPPEQQSNAPQPTVVSPVTPPPTRVQSSSPPPAAIGKPPGVKPGLGDKKKVLFPIAAVAAIALIFGLFKVISPSVEGGTPTPTPTLTKSPSGEAARSRLSFGEKALIPAEATAKKPEFQTAKQQGVEALAASDYAAATGHLEAALKQNPNAPETLIYLNNARIGNQKAHTIAVAVPIGAEPNKALEILRGVAQAQDEINRQGGMRGVPLKVAIADDNKDAEIARQVATNFVNNPDVLGVIGHTASSVTLAAGEIYNNGKLTVISAVSTSVDLSNFSPYVFRSVPSDAFAARALANQMLTGFKQQNAAVFFNSESSYSESLKKEFVTSVAVGGGKVASEIDLSQSSFDAAAAVEEAIARGAKVLMLAPNSATLDKALQVVRANRNRLQLVAGDVLYTSKTLKIGSEDAQGMVVAVFWDIDGDPDSDFPRTSKKLWKAEVNWRTAMAYDATQALIAAIATNPSRAGVQEALVAANFVAPGASEPIRFLPSGDRNASIQLVEVRPAGERYDFVPISAK